MTPGTSDHVLKYPGQNPKAKLRIHLFLPADVKEFWRTAFYVDHCKERQVTCHSSLSDTLEIRSSSCHITSTTLCSSTKKIVPHNLVFLRLFKSLPVTFAPYQFAWQLSNENQLIFPHAIYNPPFICFT